MELRWFYLYRIYLHQKEKIIQIMLYPTKSATLTCKQFQCISHCKVCKMKPSFSNVTHSTQLVSRSSLSSSSLISGSSNPHFAHTSFSFSPSISSSLPGDSAVTLFWKNSFILKLLHLLTVTLLDIQKVCFEQDLNAVLIYDKKETQRCIGFHFPCSCICMLLISFLLTLILVFCVQDEKVDNVLLFRFSIETTMRDRHHIYLNFFLFWRAQLCWDKCLQKLIDIAQEMS